MVSLSISQSEERWAMGKKCHCGICVHDLFILEGGVEGLSAIFLPLDDFFTNHWACEVEEKKKKTDADRFKLGGTWDRKCLDRMRK